jgi:hypothetical protein
MKTVRRTTLGILIVTLVVLALAPAAAQATGALRSLQDDLGVWVAAPSAQPALLDEIAYNLRVKQLRMYVHWNLAEPTQGVFNDAYLAGLKDTVTLARARGISIVATLYTTPRWASNSTYWNSPPAGYAKGYQNFYVMDRTKLDSFQAFAEHVATYFGTDVAAYECWNEPNLWNYMYPQRTTTDSIFAVRLYKDMLKKFHAGITAGNPSALVVAGATGPFGPNDKMRTSPQRWANQLRAFNLGSFFDVYSHHPYPVGPTTIVAPEAMPRDSAHTVSLGNISVLLKKFPNKPFYLTEYGYNTAFSLVFGGFKVSVTQQADFVRRAFIYVRRYPQIKYLTWLYVRDFSSTGKSSDPLGVYTGLKTLSGAKKRSYYSYAGGNTLTMVVPATVHIGARFKATGYLKNKWNGPIVGASLQIQRRAGGTTSWVTIYTTKTSTGGFYQIYRRQFSSVYYYRARFAGVVWSSGHKVVAT